MEEFRHDIEVNLSGGGYRAAAFNLGALLYLVHSRLNRKVVFISSVSGGSITNAYVAQECDFARVELDDFRVKVAAPLANKISCGGLAGRYGFLIERKALRFAALAYAASLAGALLMREWLFLGFLTAVVFLVLGPGWRMVGRWISRWLLTTFFKKNGKESRLGDFVLDLDRTAEHQFCATDLEHGTPFYFSTKGGGRIYSEVYGRGSGKEVPLYLAVRASAAYPPPFPPVTFRLHDHKWLKTPDGRKVHLSDGGVWNNLGSDWGRRDFRDAMVTAEREWMRQEEGANELRFLKEAAARVPMGAVQLMVDASAPPVVWRPGWLFVLARTTLRVAEIMYQSGLAARIVDVDYHARMRMWRNPPRWSAPGSDVPQPNWLADELPGSAPPLAISAGLTRSPGELAKAWTATGMLPHWETCPVQYQAELKQIEHRLGNLLSTEIAAQNAAVETHLVSLGRKTTLRLIIHGYLMAREAFEVAFHNTPQPTTDVDSAFFESLLD